MRAMSGPLRRGVPHTGSRGRRRRLRVSILFALALAGGPGCRSAAVTAGTSGDALQDTGGPGYEGASPDGGLPDAPGSDDGTVPAPDAAPHPDVPLTTDIAEDAGSPADTAADAATTPPDVHADTTQTADTTDPCAGHCSNGLTDCGEAAPDCGGDCPPCPASCGDGACNADESACTCPGDCGVECGDGCCGPGEVAALCCGDCGECCLADDCPPCGACTTTACTGGACACTPTEGCCGNGACDGAETPFTCPGDCPPVSQPCEGCKGGEVCVLGTCAPVAVLLASPDATPSFGCPLGYTLAGRWRTGPGAADGQSEAFDAENLEVDTGWAYLCSARPDQVRVLAKGSDCGGATSPCDGQLRGSFHVGQGCGTQSAVDAAGVSLEAGWLTLCESGGHSARVDVTADDCGSAPVGCGGWAVRGAWHTMPAACGEGITGDGASGAQVESGWMSLCVDTDRHPPADPSTLAGKALFGYQGWFGAAGDGSAVGWMHWAPGVPPAADNADFDLWPDTSELGPDELFDTAMTMPDGQPARVFSSFNPKTVDRHFRWMEEAGISGAFLQRFTSELTSPPHKAFRDTVTLNVRAAAEAHGRVWAIMVDISGTPEGSLVQTIEQDWTQLVEDLKVTESPFYLHEGGLPVLAIWGLGFTDRPGTAAQAAELIAWLQTGAPPHLRAHVVGGVPFWWRTGANDSKPGFSAVYAAFDTLSPWSVGRWDSTAGFDNLKKQVIDGDAKQVATTGQGYAPVAWPGFSWANLTGSPGSYNQIPRKGGAFFWHQVKGMLAGSPTFVYVAMFDECDEGTAMFKAATSAAQVPAQGTFLHLGADGQSLPSDWYLRLGGAAAKAAAGQLQATGQLPYQP